LAPVKKRGPFFVWGRWFSSFIRNQSYDWIQGLSIFKLKVISVGESLGIILPEEAVRLLKVYDGDFVFLTESPYGFRVTLRDPEFEEDMAIARRLMRERRDLLRELARS